ncbi:kinesin-related protein 4 [Lingula anatina]|uniref:Kinesin-related protein 4 n=1 Tax=Lingula anatina TaxID=7574 RepID=A0A1S3HE43_LINAN|nr:kinesin-related protein 4 [Lingula anatina]|eukprot:XP_013384323.1 kinesin-related protein 4 [Lingula anatina]
MENQTLSQVVNEDDGPITCSTEKKRKINGRIESGDNKKARTAFYHSISSDEESEEVVSRQPRRLHSISDSEDGYYNTDLSMNSRHQHETTDKVDSPKNSVQPDQKDTGPENESGSLETEGTLRYTLSYSPEYSPHFPIDSDKDEIDSASTGADIPDANIPGSINGRVVDTETERNEVSNSLKPASSEPVLDRPSIFKEASVFRDAQQIASVLNKGDEIQIIYEKLEQNRKVPHRVDIVTNELVEEGFIDLTKDNTQDTESSLLQDVDKVVQVIHILHPGKTVDPNIVFELLERNLHKENRVQFVVDTILAKEKDEKNEIVPKEQGNEGSDDIMKEVGHISQLFPNVDPNEIFVLLEEKNNINTRKKDVIDELKSRKTSNSENQSVVIPVDNNESNSKSRHAEEKVTFDNDPIYTDMQFLARMFPDKDRNEIYAYLEAHHQNPNRIQVVAEEFLRMQGGSQDEEGTNVKLTPLSSQNSEESFEMLHDVKTASGEDKGTNHSTEDKSHNTPAVFDDTPKTRLEIEVEELKAIFPDCDPDYLVKALIMRENDPERSKHLAAQMLETKNFPRLKDVIEKQKKFAKKKQLEKMRSHFDIKEFLQMFDDPQTYFYDEAKPVSNNYKNCAIVQLMNDFPLMKDPYIRTIFEKHKFHFAPTVRELAEEAGDFRGRKKRSEKFLKKRRRQEKLPSEVDEILIKEMLFVQHEQDIKDYLEEQKKERETKIAEAREKKELYECGCCYDDEVLFEEMVSCADGHLFCQTCVRRSSEELIGQTKTKFPCLTSDCTFEFSTSVLQKVLSPKIFSNLLRRLQEEEIRQADIPDLVSCPFCSFATIMSNPEDKVFKCLNPECLKESCRLCKEPNHVPFHCDEVERQGETSMRTFIENKISEAMLRTCWKCKKRFYKVEGCNKMTCSCGASMCYVCRKPIRDYSHFGDRKGQCPADTDVFELHRKEMEEAGKEAKKKFESEHPGTELKFDPMKFVAEYKTNRNNNWTYESDEDDSEEDGYEDFEELSDDSSDSSESSDDDGIRYHYF